eukprot:COSAG04_NODE_17010_length_482_cov_0.814621_1_plen_137_part_10
MSHVPSYTITKPATTQAGKLGRGGCAPLVLPFPPSSPSPPRVRLAHRPQRACAGHADYPYRPGRFLDDVYPESPRFGVQYNVCVDEFTPENVSRHDTQRCHLGCILLKIPPSALQGATQFIPESHHSGRDPPLEMQM